LAAIIEQTKRVSNLNNTFPIESVSRFEIKQFSLVLFHISNHHQIKQTGKLEEEEVRVLENGDYFGEQALLKEECRSANVIALPPGVECLTLGRE
jgi:CRP-like cAMP-binding protein